MQVFGAALAIFYIFLLFLTASVVFCTFRHEKSNNTSALANDRKIVLQTETAAKKRSPNELNCSIVPISLFILCTQVSNETPLYTNHGE
jgi:hypothetical protein